MVTQRQRRQAVSLIEVLIVVAIVAVLFSLLLVAVISARRSADRTTSSNNLRQIGLALQAFIDQNQGELPGLEDRWLVGPPWEINPLFSLLPHLEQGTYYREYRALFNEPGQHGCNVYGLIKVLISPADPTRQTDLKLAVSRTSYVANAVLFPRDHLKVGEVTDGLSNTIAYAERYSYRCNGYIKMWCMQDATMRIGYHPALKYPPGTSWRRPTFADMAAGDVVPQQFPQKTIGSAPGLTFQVAPRLSECDHQLAQTPHPEGMLAALADGSVRLLARGMAEPTYWAALTRNWNDALGSDW